MVTCTHRHGAESRKVTGEHGTAEGGGSGLGGVSQAQEADGGGPG